MGSVGICPTVLNEIYDVQQLMGHVSVTRATEEEILDLLRKLADKRDTSDTLTKKVNSVLLLEPNFFGLGININALVDRVLAQFRGGKARRSQNDRNDGGVL